MESIMKTILVCIAIGYVYGAPAETTEQPEVKILNPFREEKTFDVEGEPLTETLETIDDGLIIEIDAQRGNGALTVFMDNTHELLLHKYNDDGNCYISSLADYNKTQLPYASSSSVFKYRLEPVSEINTQYFSHTATDAMKRVCNGAKDLLWSEIHAVSDELETREKRSCGLHCGLHCSLYGCSYGCVFRCVF